MYTPEQAAELAVGNIEYGVICLSPEELAAMLNAAQATPQSEPVAWRITDGEGGFTYRDEWPDQLNVNWSARYGRQYEPLYTALPDHTAPPAQATPQSGPAAWMDDFGNAFPLAANKGAGSWLDEHKRNWNPLYTAPPDHTALLRRALQSLQYHTSQTRPLHDTDQTITAIKKALGKSHD